MLTVVRETQIVNFRCVQPEGLGTVYTIEVWSIWSHYCRGSFTPPPATTKMTHKTPGPHPYQLPPSSTSHTHINNLCLNQQQQKVSNNKTRHLLSTYLKETYISHLPHNIQLKPNRMKGIHHLIHLCSLDVYQDMVISDRSPSIDTAKCLRQRRRRV